MRRSLGKGPAVKGLWTKEEVSDVHMFADSNEGVIWGCDIEETQPQLLIGELASLNPDDRNLKRMRELTKDGYKIGRASCKERVKIAVVAVSVKKIGTSSMT